MEWFDVDTWKTTWTTFTTSNNASRGHIASSRPMLTKGCCKGNNYEQRFALDTFPADFSWRNILAKPCILLFTWQQDCNTREACRLLLVVKVVFVVFPNSAGRIANSTNPITRFSGWTKKFPSSPCFRFCGLSRRPCWGLLTSVSVDKFATAFGRNLRLRLPK